ncbi:MAG: hypothetical protein KDE33_20815, partial [Bacteroidetes bacterium]|nr:hypothetical protein [Bacteroidota bacterium]
MQIAKRYLTEIEEICHGKCSEEVAQTLYWAVLNHWNLPDEYSGLFEYCRPIGCRIACSCLTQVRSSWNGDLKINGVIDFQGRSIVDLSERLATDDRIVDNEDNIFPEDL